MIETFLIGLFGAVALVCGVLMLILRHPMRVALALITAMLSLGAIYGLLGVHAVAVFQVLIYVGAVMVFIVYVIMLLDTRDPSFEERYSRWLIPGAVVGVALVLAIGWALLGESAPSAPVPHTAFDVKSFSTAFLTDYWLHFELISILLVAAVVGALAVILPREGDRG